MTANIQAIGVYSWPFTEADVQAFCEDAYGSALPDQMNDSRSQLAGLYLLELLVASFTGPFDVGELCQAAPDERDDSIQAPYDESFWSADGSEYLGHYDPPDEPPFRVVFFLHEFRPGVPLFTAEGHVIPLPSATPLPKRLADSVRYSKP